MSTLPLDPKITLEAKGRGIRDAQTIEIQVDPDIMFEKFVDRFWLAHITEMSALRKEPFTRDDLANYLRTLIAWRCDQVAGKKVDIRLLNSWFVPSFVAVSLAQVGVWRDLTRNIKFVPVFEGEKMDNAMMTKISEDLQILLDPKLITRGAYPKDITGERDVMASIIVEGYVRSAYELDDTALQFVIAYLGLRVQMDVINNALFRIEYDSLDFLLTGVQDLIGVVHHGREA